MLTDEQAKAAQEIAKLGQKSLETGEKVGGFFRTTFRASIANLAEAAADWTTGFKVRNRAAVFITTRKKLDELGVSWADVTLDDRSAVPLIEALELEADPALQEVWAQYIANSLAPDQPVTINRLVTNIVRNLEPHDLKIIQRLSLDDLSQAKAEAQKMTADDFGIDPQALDFSLARFVALGLFAFDNVDGLTFSGADACKPCRLSIDTRFGEYRAQPLLMLFLQSIATPHEGG
ncbi:hypothetical protein [Ensifer sp. 1H6]|uniref:Abi-alpha family protein n=1 Tax=Ensifer sp. 1H6 TaxID=1911585 RepID=UPI0009CCB4BA|nr:hypothetical protein [Ensifer sp. 1H6]OMQ42058.1 hypothetical protein BKP54_25295 [Ensifer sp. 1H6]